LYYCCGAEKTVNKQAFIHASYHIAETAIFEYYCCDRKSRAACAQSFAPWQQATIEITRRDHSYCLFAPHTYIFILRAHPVRGESYNQRNTTGEVATLCILIFSTDVSGI